MSEPTPDIYEEDQLLAQAAKMDFVLMREMHDRVLETEDVPSVGTLTLAYSRYSRMMRQNLSCLAKQRAEREKAKRQRPERELHDFAVETRITEVQHAVDRVISAAADGDEKVHTDWAHRFDREVDDWTEKPDWLEEDLDTVVRRACKTLGLPDDYAARWRELPEPTFFPDPEPETPEAVAAANAAARDLADQYAPPDPAPQRLPPPYDRYDSG